MAGDDEKTYEGETVYYDRHDECFCIPLEDPREDGHQKHLQIPMKAAIQLAEFINQVIEDEDRRKKEMN